MTNYRVKVEKAMNLLKEATKEVEAVIACDPKNELFYERMDRNNPVSYTHLTLPTTPYV